MVNKFLIALLLMFIFVSPVDASEFEVDSTVTYDVSEEGLTTVTHDISLKNKFPSFLAKSYVLGLENIDPLNVRAFENGEEISVRKTKTDNRVDLEVTFADPAIGAGSVKEFTILYEETTFATKTGEVWEVSIPRISSPENFVSYTARLLVPTAFGKASYVSPEAQSYSTENGVQTYVFSKDTLSTAGVVAAFGEFQIFSFDLNYHLENPLKKASIVELAIPPDTAFQKVYHESIVPSPKTVFVDTDGNWIAKYELKPRERLDVRDMGTVQIFAEPRELPYSGPGNTLASSEYWQVQDPAIVALANQLKTPRNIYEYVAGNLKYDFTRVRPNADRLGANYALANPNSAICMEFTDLFIALSRSVGIPAREVNGFAYTENPEIQPLSLVSDVLHAWPEYWDGELGIWIPVDPTWGATTGGVNYFDKLDLRHFTFVNHGADPTKPYPPGSYKLGANPQKDVFVNFGRLPETRQSRSKMVVSKGKMIPFMDQKISIIITNPGPAALYNQTISVEFDGQTFEQDSLETLLPYETVEYSFNIPFSFFGTNTPDTIEFYFGNQVKTIDSSKALVLVYSALILVTLILSVAIALLMKMGKFVPKNWYERIAKRVKYQYAKIKKITKDKTRS